MPFYKCECNKCNEGYEVWAHMMSNRDSEVKKAKCPKCKSKSKNEVIDFGVAFQFANPVGTDRWNSDAKGHDYRFKHNAPNVRKQREFAEKNSHVGATPYNNIDDVSGGKYFGEVK